MIRKMISAAVLILFLNGCATTTGVKEREKTSGTSVPVITESFASTTLNPGDTWKVYLKASDPDGDMRYVVASVSQSGRGEYSPSRTRIREENAKELNGFIYLNTMVPGGYEFLNFVIVNLTVQIQDRAGHYSKPVVFPLSFSGRYLQEPPPPGVFNEQDLGPIMVTLQPFDSDGHGGSGFGF
jgi:hypothetical protein